MLCLHTFPNAWRTLNTDFPNYYLAAQLLLLIPIALALRSVTGQPLRRISLIAAICFPLHRNLLYGQYYILLLAMLLIRDTIPLKPMTGVGSSAKKTIERSTGE